MRNRDYIKALKKGVDAQIKMVEKPILMGLKASDDKKITAAQKEGIIGAEKMIMDIHKYSIGEGINESKWIIQRIKKLIEVSKTPVKQLLDAISSDYSDNYDEEDVKDFYNVKEKASQNYNEIAESIKGLEELLSNVDEQGNIIIKDRGEFRASWPEWHADRPSKAGYREDIDAVAIDPNGTVGEIITIQNLRIALPELPENVTFINEHIKDKKEQSWIREELPFGIRKETEDNFKEYIEEQYRRKHEGVWFLNNGKPEYLTGAHWFLLQWCKTDADDDGIHGKGWFHYRKAHRDIFYFAEAVWCDPRSLGMIYVKTRRTGATFDLLGFMLSKAIAHSWKNFGMTSKTEPDARNNFNNKMMPMFSNLPFFFKPIRLSDSPKRVLEFKEPQRRITKTNKNQNEEYEALMTEISYRATTEDAYDGDAIMAYLGDEFSKWKKGQNTLEHFRMLARAFTKGGKITGKGFFISTVENIYGIDDVEDKDAGSGDYYKYLYNSSDVTKRNANGRTESGLYSLFIPCDDNYEGFIDTYGNCIKNTPKEPIMGVDGQWIKKGVLEFFDEEAKSKDTAEKLYNFWRLNPRNIEDAFRVVTDEAIFNLDNITRQITINNNSSTPYIRGNFEWVGGVIPNSPEEANVEFIPNPKGKFNINWIPEMQYRNAKFKKGRRIIPGNGFAGALGCDPYRVSETSNRKGSNGSFHLVTGPNNPIGPSNRFVLEYCHRPEDVKVFTWDLIKASVFYGIPFLMESNVTDSLRYIEEWGYREYSMNRPDKKPGELNKHESQLGGQAATTDSINDYDNMLAWWINHFVGTEEDKEAMPFNDTLEDWIKYNRKNRTKRDRTVSSSLAIFASRKQAFTHKPSTERRTAPKTLSRRYRIEGGISKRI